METFLSFIISPTQVFGVNSGNPKYSANSLSPINLMALPTNNLFLLTVWQGTSLLSLQFCLLCLSALLIYTVINTLTVLR